MWLSISILDKKFKNILINLPKLEDFNQNLSVSKRNSTYQIII